MVAGWPLVGRERELGELAASLANPNAPEATAETLFVSSRTVENHLQRVYEKLGIRGRDELPASVTEQPNVEVSS